MMKSHLQNRHRKNIVQGQWQKNEKYRRILQKLGYNNEVTSTKSSPKEYSPGTAAEKGQQLKDLLAGKLRKEQEDEIRSYKSPNYPKQEKDDDYFYYEDQASQKSEEKVEKKPTGTKPKSQKSPVDSLGKTKGRQEAINLAKYTVGPPSINPTPIIQEVN